MTDDEWVWVIGSNRRKNTKRYHTDKTCRHLERDGVREPIRKRKSVLHPDSKECRECAGIAIQTGGSVGEGSHYHSLKQAAQEQSQ